tara:strand:+ start:3741 stop:3947 length:207 start_codon:yes stop_codon:yes gene_type:complete
VVCPGYKSKNNHKIPVMKLPDKNMVKLVSHLEKEGFKKHATTVAKKMMRYGKGMNNYSKTTGKLKVGH